MAKKEIKPKRIRYNNQYHIERYIKYKKIVMEHYGNKCSCCGETNFWFLALDHKNNDGYKLGRSRKVMRFSTLVIRSKEHGYPKSLQILCYNCNQGKNNPINKYICPHKFI